MSNVLPYPELWLLELGAKNGAPWSPLALLPDTAEVRKRGFSEQWNCPPHGLSGKELSAVLWRLFGRGEIEFKQSVSRDGDSSIVPIPVSATDVYEKMLFDVEELRRRRKSNVRWPLSFYYRVTHSGIARWEAYALPNWDRYRGEFSGRLDEPGKTIWTQSATTEEFAREVLDVYATQLNQPATLHWATATVTLHKLWMPFLGKELPQGVTLSVRATEHGHKSFGGEDWRLEDWQEHKRACDEHYRRFCEICRWYRTGTRNHPDRPLPQTEIQ